MWEQQIARDLSIGVKQVVSVLELIKEGSTVPFIARYRKEKTGGLDEVQIINIKNEHERLEAFQKRKEYILQHIEEQGKLSPELKKAIESCIDAALLEDLYLPYKTRRKTRADIAREKGLEPLAKTIFEQKEVRVLQNLNAFLSDKVNLKQRRFKEPKILLPNGSMKIPRCVRTCVNNSRIMPCYIRSLHGERKTIPMRKSFAIILSLIRN